jgi:hypothetical protein
MLGSQDSDEAFEGKKNFTRVISLKHTAKRKKILRFIWRHKLI